MFPDQHQIPFFQALKIAKKFGRELELPDRTIHNFGELLKAWQDVSERYKILRNLLI